MNYADAKGIVDKLTASHILAPGHFALIYGSGALALGEIIHTATLDIMVSRMLWTAIRNIDTGTFDPSCILGPCMVLMDQGRKVRIFEDTIKFQTLKEYAPNGMPVIRQERLPRPDLSHYLNHAKDAGIDPKALI